MSGADTINVDARPQIWPRVRFVLSWVLALALVGVGVPRAVDISWHGVWPVLGSLHWPALFGLIGLWSLGLFVHSFVLTAAAPGLSRRRALTLNVTGSAVANVVPLGGAAGVELNRRMMKTWGIGGRGFTGYTFLTNLWDIGSKLLLPVIAVLVLTHAGEAATAPLRLAAVVAAIGFVGVVSFGAILILSPRCTAAVGRAADRLVRLGAHLIGRSPERDVVGALLGVRRECLGLVANGWLRMSMGISGYVALQGLLLAACLHLAGAGNAWPEVLAGFALERMLTIVPLTPGGVGVADLGLVGVLLAFGGDPAGVAAGAVLYRLFVFAVEVPVGGGVWGLWLLERRLATRPVPQPIRWTGAAQRIAQVTDVFLPRLGGIEIHVDDLVRHQRARGMDVEVLTPRAADRDDDPPWVRRMPLSQARQAIGQYDVVHVHLSVLSPYGIGVARAAMAAGVPTVVTVHSMWAGAGGILRLVSVVALRRWPVVWSAVSAATAETFARSICPEPVAVLSNAIDVTSWRRGIVDTKAVECDGVITLVSVMRLMPRKRPMKLLKMFEQVSALTPGRHVQLLIVGDGPQRHRIERYIERRGIGPDVRLTGRLPRGELLARLCSASIYVAPAPKESFGIAALEARSAGLPVVAHRVSGVGEFIRDHVDGILVADDREMSGAIAELVLDKDLRGRISSHNRRIAPSFDWSEALNRTDDLYRDAGERVAARSGEEVAATRQPATLMAEA